MKQKLRDYFAIFFITLIVTQAVNYAIKLILDYKIYDANNWAFQLTINSIIFSIFFANINILKLKWHISIIGSLLFIKALIVFFLGLFPFHNLFLLRHYLIYPNLISAASLVLFYLIWIHFKLQYVRALSFSLGSAFIYSLVYKVAENIGLPPAMHKPFFVYFTSSIFIYIGISFSFDIVGMIINRLLPDYSFDKTSKYTLKEKEGF